MMTPSKADFYVNLKDPKAKGIHMSRLYLTAQKILENQILSWDTISDLLNGFVGSHDGLSDQSLVRFSFDYMVKRPSLVSSYSGWRFYPVVYQGVLTPDAITFDFHLHLTYSSTCPCSAALSRQLIQENFKKNFKNEILVNSEEVFDWLGSEQGIIATPHGQRSHADIHIRFNKENEVPIIDLINQTEGALKTAVQTAVKREDEQEFALLNGSNLMFCEDSARRIKSVLDQNIRISDYRIHTSHLESLHPHNAEAIVIKGIPGGLKT